MTPETSTNPAVPADVLTADRVKELVTRHERWLMGETDGERLSLHGSELVGAKLFGANLEQADLSGARLADADLRGANLEQADLSGADLSYANLTCANLKDADLSRAILREADLSNALLRRASLEDALLDNTDLYVADLDVASFRGATLRHVNLSGAILDGADFEDAKLHAVTWRGARLDYVRLEGVMPDWYDRDFMAHLLWPWAQGDMEKERWLAWVRQRDDLCWSALEKRVPERLFHGALDYLLAYVKDAEDPDLPLALKARHEKREAEKRKSLLNFDPAPGSWNASPLDGEHEWAVYAGPVPIARVQSRPKVNGPLIAAAPDLLSACREALNALGEPLHSSDSLRIRERLEAAIARAEGKAPDGNGEE